MPSREDSVSLEVLREAARLRAADTSLRQAAREIGVSHQALAAFVNGSEPYGKNLAKIREWYGRETNDLLRLRLEVTALRKRVAELEQELRKAK